MTSSPPPPPGRPGPIRATGPAWTRRSLLAAGGVLAAGLIAGLGRPARADTAEDLEAIEALKPGQYVWYPDRAPDGFVAVVVNLSEQRAFVYRNGIRIGVSTVSSGRDGHATPTGVFTILGKDVDHHSSTYNNAPMPYSERLTWSGVALHAGGLPGYPSSHGCVHLPLAFAKDLFSVTHVGTPVIIADAHEAPEDVLEPGLLLGGALEQQLAGARRADVSLQAGGFELLDGVAAQRVDQFPDQQPG